MKYNLIFFLLLMVVNTFAGLIFDNYEWVNFGFTSVVLVCNFLLIHILCLLKIKDAFKIALPFLFSFFEIIEFVLAIFTPAGFANNIHLMCIVGLILFQIMLLLIINVVSKNS